MSHSILNGDICESGVYSYCINNVYNILGFK